MHAELIVPFFRKNNDVTIFAPYIESANKWWHHKIVREDEEYVVRCYEERDPNEMKGKEGKMDIEKILDRDVDVLLVESYASIPHKDVQRVAEILGKRGIKTYVVIHEGFRGDIRYSNLTIFEKFIVFDERYIYDLIPEIKDKAIVIPYPCYPLNPSKRKFGDDHLKFFSFGRQPIEEYYPFLKALERLKRIYDLEYLVVRSNGLLPYKKEWLIQERKRFKNTDEIYNYLHRADVHLIPKGYTEGVVVSSTLYQCMGALIPTIVPDTRHFEMHEDEVIKFNDIGDLVRRIVLIIEDDEYRDRVIKAAKEYVEKNSADKIAKRFIKVFNDKL